MILLSAVKVAALNIIFAVGYVAAYSSPDTITLIDRHNDFTKQVSAITVCFAAARLLLAGPGLPDR